MWTTHSNWINLISKLHDLISAIQRRWGNITKWNNFESNFDMRISDIRNLEHLQDLFASNLLLIKIMGVRLIETVKLALYDWTNLKIHDLPLWPELTTLLTISWSLKRCRIGFKIFIRLFLWDAMIISPGCVDTCKKIFLDTPSVQALI